MLKNNDFTLEVAKYKEISKRLIKSLRLIHVRKVSIDPEVIM